MSGSYKILFLGDVMGKPGRVAVRDGLPALQDIHQPLFTIINGENSAAGVGITPDICEELYRYGADAITLGNHAFNKREIGDYLNSNKPIVRPINMPEGTPGRGHIQVQKDEIALNIANICGRVFLDSYDDPFAAFNRLVKQGGDHWFIDFHAEATSEKVAFGYHAEGRASAVVGTHTHIQTADEKVLPGGTAYITDVGMTGPQNGVIGMDRDIVLRKFITGMPARFEVADGPGVIYGVVIEIERESGRALDIERIRFAPQS